MQKKVEIKKHILVTFLLISSIFLFFVTLTLAQYSNEPEVVYYNILENRTDISDTYLIKTIDYKNGTILRTYQTHLYTHPVNMLDNGIYKPFTDVANLQWNDLSESFILSWQGKRIKIKPIIIDSQNKEYSINEVKNLYPQIIFNYNIEKTRRYRYGITLSNLSQEFQQNIKSFKFSLIELQGLSLDDLKNSENSIIVNDLIEIYFENSSTDMNFSAVYKTTLNAGDVSNKSEINVEMIVRLT